MPQQGCLPQRFEGILLLTSGKLSRFSVSLNYNILFLCMQPENLLLDSLGNLKISDFGLSALPEQVRQLLLFIVSPFFTTYIITERNNEIGLFTL